MIIPGIAKPDLPFNHVVRADRFLFLTSQLSVDLKTGIIQSGNIVEQTQRSLDNIKFLLSSCGATTLIHHQKVKKGHFGVNSVAKLQ